MRRLPDFRWLLMMLMVGSLPACRQATTHPEKHRPEVHFTPPAHWMNDPNGMVFYNGIYHLFYQYYPDSTVWGPMHWGHATSTNLVDWQHQPIALYPDSLGLIFSGSAVVDHHNTSGFGTNGKPPLVAIFTHHGEKNNPAFTNSQEVQSIAYSNDEGKTWTKYAGNPVLTNPGISDFRDPKVMWHAPSQRWVMTLAAKDRIMFYSSPDLKTWQRESEFGADHGAHGGVWECPDLVPFPAPDGEKWVLIVNINPGGPNGGSGTQYFVGQFDGSHFEADHTDIRWMDYGPDNYAGVTWSNTDNRAILIGWMSNWQYAQAVPTQAWRSAMTIPRQLALKAVGNAYYLQSVPVNELRLLEQEPQRLNLQGASPWALDRMVNDFRLPCRIDLQVAAGKSWQFEFKNDKGESLSGGYDAEQNHYFLDRTKAGESAFDTGFARIHTAPRISRDNTSDITLVVDVSSIEFFADNGTTVLTQVFFPNSLYHRFSLHSATSIPSITYTNLRKSQGNSDR